MPISETDRLAAEVEDRWLDFQNGLSNKRRYPVEQFRAFWETGKRYAELTKNDPLIHRKVVVAINGLREFGQASPDDGDALALTFAQPVQPAGVEEPDEEEAFGRYTGSSNSGWMR